MHGVQTGDEASAVLTQGHPPLYYNLLLDGLLGGPHNCYQSLDVLLRVTRHQQNSLRCFCHLHPGARLEQHRFERLPRTLMTVWMPSLLAAAALTFVAVLQCFGHQLPWMFSGWQGKINAHADVFPGWFEVAWWPRQSKE